VLGFTVNVSSIYRKLFQFFLIVAYGALFWWLLRFLEVDACLDAGVPLMLKLEIA
jgi:hypothetical protein